jgi:predicted ABC-type ATPase
LADQSRIYVLAGVNGAGKSSIGGAAFRERGSDYYNPDEAAREIREAHPELTSMTTAIRRNRKPAECPPYASFSM